MAASKTKKRGRPAKLRGHGALTVRAPTEVLDQLRIIAALEKTSVNDVAKGDLARFCREHPLRRQIKSLLTPK